MKIKLIVGFRRDQEHSIEAEEAHKAYYLFTHPTERGIFGNGLAIKGDQIQEIVPDYQGTMGWNASHQLDDDDWNEIRGRGVDRKLREILYHAKQLAQSSNPQIDKPLSEAIKSLPPKLDDIDTSGLADKMRLK